MKVLSTWGLYDGIDGNTVLFPLTDEETEGSRHMRTFLENRKCRTIITATEEAEPRGWQPRGWSELLSEMWWQNFQKANRD